jgi:rhodanese-related sulfurtransferase
MLIFACIAGCSQNDIGYISISAEQAKELMDKSENYIILDVRTKEEFDEIHIPNAMLIPDTEIADRVEDELTDKDQLIFVYCRSGNRSKKASAILTEMGYTNIKEFGGIKDWPYETE